MHRKLKNLQAYFKKAGAAAIAFSGGVDSTFLLATAAEVLPKEKVLAITVASSFFPRKEKSEAQAFCAGRNIKHIFLPIDVLAIDGVKNNPQNRCYLCKRALFAQIKEQAAKNGMDFVCEGSNTDDLNDYRPGMQAVEELHIKSPLRDAGLNKSEIRILSKEMNLPTWNKPSFACLASRFVYGEEITAEKLTMVEKAEQLLSDLGFEQRRVRIQGLTARIEILPQDFSKIVTDEVRQKICADFSKIGFVYTSLDLNGYRSGSMNETFLRMETD